MNAVLERIFGCEKPTATLAAAGPDECTTVRINQGVPLDDPDDQDDDEDDEIAPYGETLLERIFGCEKPTATLAAAGPDECTTVRINQGVPLDDPDDQDDEDDEIAPYGETFGTLTRFGSVWIPARRILAVDFDPEDCCGAEVFLIGKKKPMHLGHSEANALQRYMQEGGVMEQILRDKAA